ncbi:MAG TPA: hypothetical protein PLJ29_01180 [Leptospiraceae bacterium]|nr:hypothetical protein [Leptospiraceae bacterium]HNF23906.1 hypothetical protein [Leptospiraceae bacterium]HNH08915.1 hypothetical protein [Leptospiraceae bacterium]HNI24940.1 hypothetical protein [Leptospiraceae bacterium]HNI96232.1 hypothetical protein [Leptospiraceae bacterium]
MYNRFDERLSEEAEKFYRSGTGNKLMQKTGKVGKRMKSDPGADDDLHPLLNAAGIWMEEYARRKKWNGDELSETYIAITEKILQILFRFKKNGYSNFPSYLGKYIKNCRMNIMRRDFERDNPALFELWDEEGNFRRALTAEEPLKKNQNLRNALLALNPLNRMVISMRYNLSFMKSDADTFLKLMNESDRTEMMCRKEKLYQWEQKFLERLTGLTKRILERKDNERKLLSERKKRLLKKLMRPRELFSIAELGKIFGMPESRIARVCKVSISQIREEYEKSLKSSD